MYNPIENKYTKWYNLLIESRRHRVLDTSIYFEKHHVIPKSLGGSNSSNNLIKLLPKEHFIAHLLLSKMFEDNLSKRKMSYALWQMTYNGTGNRYKINNSRTFAYMRKNMSETHSGENHHMYGKVGKLNPRFGVKHTEEVKKIIGEKSKLKDYSEEYRKKLSDTSKERWSNPEYKERLSNKHKGRSKSEEHKKNISIANKGKHTGRNEKLAGENHYSKKIGFVSKKKGRKEEIVRCPHCVKSGGKTLMKRWHFDNCKNRKDSLL
jgi:hypothetical protein